MTRGRDLHIRAVEAEIGQQLQRQDASAAALAIDRDAASFEVGEARHLHVAAHEDPDRLEIEARQRAQRGVAIVVARAALGEGDIRLAGLQQRDVLHGPRGLGQGDVDAFPRHEVAINAAVIIIDAVAGTGRHHDAARRRGLDEVIGDGEGDERQQHGRPEDADPFHPDAEPPVPHPPRLPYRV
jgi:hypothetical protein